MKTSWLKRVAISGICLILYGCQSHKTSPNFRVDPIPESVQMKMKQSTWKASCPIPLKDLRYLELGYWGYDDKPHQGHLIVHKDISQEILSIFKRLYDKKFPIERMMPMYHFQGNDEASMSVNNTSAFNCRDITGKPGKFSNHSYGKAIDINPLINPYVKGKLVLPQNAHPFVDREKSYKGKIDRASLVYKLFTQYGWKWGGEWVDLQDYQHFEK